MDIKLNRDEFIKSLQKFITITEKKNKNEILSSVLIIAENEKLTIIGTNLEIGVMSVFQCNIIQPGSVTVNPRKIYDILKDIDDKEIEIKKKDDSSEIITSLGSFQLLGQDVAFFPKILFEEPDDYIKIICLNFVRSISCVLPFVQNNDSSSPALSGIFFDFKGSELSLVATDTHRLAVAKVKNCENTNNISFILPKRGADELKKIIEKENNEYFLLGKKDNKLIIKTINDIFVCRFIDANYPSYLDVVPKNTTSVVFSTKSLIQRIKNIAIISSTELNSVKIELKKNTIKLITENRSIGRAELLMECTYGGEDLSIGFNVEYFLSGLQNIQCEASEMLINGNETAVILHGINDDDFIYVVMPLKLENISY